jgi:hypothetical protein
VFTVSVSERAHFEVRTRPLIRIAQIVLIGALVSCDDPSPVLPEYTFAVEPAARPAETKAERKSDVDEVSASVGVALTIKDRDSSALATVEISNHGSKEVELLKWDLGHVRRQGLTWLMKSLFNITRDGQAVDYTGKFVDSGAPVDEDFLLLKPGYRCAFQVPLDRYYDMAGNGEFTVTYLAYAVRTSALPLVSNSVVFKKR